MDEIRSLPLFPLSDVVLLPEVSVPLFVFEPRYRQMTRDALSGARRIGMVTVRPDSVSDMAGDPRIFEIGCVGRIADAQERPDGTFQILLLGESRFRVLAEEPRLGDRLYRSAHVALLADAVPTDTREIDALVKKRAELLDLLGRIVRRASSQDLDPAEVLAHFEGLEQTRLVNALTQAISFRPIERQQLLEAESILSRFETMADLLRFRLAEGSVTPSGTRPLPN